MEACKSMSITSQICSFEIEKYTKRFSFGGIREGVYIHLKDTDGRKATGEVSPLPGRSLETLEMVLTDLNRFKNNFLDNNLTPFALHPSVMFGMQMALYSLQNDDPIFFPPITKLYLTPPIFTSSGPVKLKLGNYSVNDATIFYNKFLRKDKTIRIDLERKWDIKKSIEFCKGIDTSSLLYVEDPVTNYCDLEKFYRETGVEFAVDNFIPFQPVEKIKALEGLHSAIIKPTLVGGLHECRNLQAAFAPIPISFSSLFETSVGIHHIKVISSILCGENPVGVDTLKFLKSR